MRYTKGKVSYIHRTNFTALDWNEYHQKEGIQVLQGRRQRPIARFGVGRCGEVSRRHLLRETPHILLMHSR